jgi:hypothetical protein
MIKIEKYVVAGKEFTDKDKAEKYEKMALDIKQNFIFYVEHKDKTCDFANGEYAIQRDKEFYNKFLDTLNLMINKYEKWIVNNCVKNGQVWEKEFIKGYVCMRCLDDNDSYLYRYGIILLNICPVCFREYGQMYYALHCNHSAEVKPI